MLAVLDGAHHHVIGEGVTTNELQHHLNIGIIHHFDRVGGQLDILRLTNTRLGQVTSRGLYNLDRTTGSASDLLSITLQYIDGTPTNGTQSEQTNFNRIHDHPYLFLISDKITHRKGAESATPIYSCANTTPPGH
jgi:hypothetical protein